VAKPEILRKKGMSEVDNMGFNAVVHFCRKTGTSCDYAFLVITFPTYTHRLDKESTGHRGVVSIPVALNDEHAK
jgi:hypothetical protein